MSYNSIDVNNQERRSMSKVVSIRLKDEQYERLRKLARRLDRTPSETVVRVLEEGLREREFPYIVFKDTAVGR
jgi:predicted DNA-binding protein